MNEKLFLNKNDARKFSPVRRWCFVAVESVRFHKDLDLCADAVEVAVEQL